MLHFRLEEKRLRQEQLARERIAARLAMRNQRTNEKAGDITVPEPDDTDDVVGWQDALIKEVEFTHEQERELLLEVY